MTLFLSRHCKRTGISFGQLCFNFPSNSKRGTSRNKAKVPLFVRHTKHTDRWHPAPYLGVGRVHISTCPLFVLLIRVTGEHSHHCVVALLPVASQYLAKEFFPEIHVTTATKQIRNFRFPFLKNAKQLSVLKIIIGAKLRVVIFLKNVSQYKVDVYWEGKGHSLETWE